LLTSLMRSGLLYRVFCPSGVSVDKRMYLATVYTKMTVERGTDMGIDYMADRNTPCPGAATASPST
jgi:hypothetical protein